MRTPRPQTERHRRAARRTLADVTYISGYRIDNDEDDYGDVDDDGDDDAEDDYYDDDGDGGGHGGQDPVTNC